MFEMLYLLFSWLPPPLDVIFFGAFCILAVLAVGKFIAFIIDILPFL